MGKWWYKLEVSKERRPANAGERNSSRNDQRAYGVVRARLYVDRHWPVHTHNTSCMRRDQGFFSFFLSSEVRGRSSYQLPR